MTKEAQEYLLKLFKKNPYKFFEFNDDSKFGVSSAILDGDNLTTSEEEKIKYLILNGAPTLTIERRHNQIFGEFPNLEYNCVPFKNPVLGYEFGFQKGKNIDTSFERMSKSRLRETLFAAEREENYEECAKIIKYAEGKGWDLNKS